MEFSFSCSIWSNWTLEDKFHISARPCILLCKCYNNWAILVSSRLIFCWVILIRWKENCSIQYVWNNENIKNHLLHFYSIDLLKSTLYVIPSGLSKSYFIQAKQARKMSVALNYFQSLVTLQSRFNFNKSHWKRNLSNIVEFIDWCFVARNISS